MPGVVVRYAKGKGFLMDEHLAKVWVCSQLTNIIRNLSEEQAGISVVPEKLRTLDRGRPWRDSQFASTRLSPSRDMSR